MRIVGIDPNKSSEATTRRVKIPKYEKNWLDLERFKLKIDECDKISDLSYCNITILTKF